MRSDGGGIALWRGIVDALGEEIAAGALAAGARLPTEAELAARFTVNRHTVRRALAVLAEGGWIRTEQGRGSFVQPRPASAARRGGAAVGPGGTEDAGAATAAPVRLRYPLGRRTRFSEIVGAQSRAPAGRLIAHAMEAASRDIAERLAVAPGTPVHRLETLHVADGTPISMATCWFPAERFPRLVTAYAESGSLTRALADHGCADFVRLTTRILARPATPDEAARLDLAPDAIVLAKEAVDGDGTGRPIQFSRGSFAADRVEIVVESG